MKFKMLTSTIYRRNSFDVVWRYTGNMNTRRRNHAAILLQSGLVLVAGGDAGSCVSSCELYNPKTDNWTLTGNMSDDRCANTLSMLTNGKVLNAIKKSKKPLSKNN